MTPGTKLGPYEIVALIGAGGMGEVYRAHDPRLNRDVAIKVSAERFSERFEREAKAVAALNHPNICQIYDVGPNFIVMEFVEGEAPKGPLPLDTALSYARQIGDALEAAHERNIVHRDLKPANIKVTPVGTVKVLDFGLAKFSTPEPGATSENSPTLTMHATQAGVVLGTAAYMSPEQARGKVVDKRADIWAFGVVLYEMISGKKLFEGEDLTETLASVVKDEPKLEETPFEVRRLLKKCLQKDPKKRLRDIGDAWELLDERPAVATGTAIPSRMRFGMPALIVACVFAAAFAVLAFIHFREQPPAAELTRFQIPYPDSTSVPFGIPAEISPDGRRLAFEAQDAQGVSRLWVRSLDSLDSRQLPGVDLSPTPQPFFWSWDSRFLAFYASDHKLKRVDVTGGPPQTLCDAADVDGGSWSKDGVILFGGINEGIMRVPETGGTAAAAITSLNAGRQEIGHMFPKFLPDGRHFLYFHFSTAVQNSGIYVGSIDAKPADQSAQPLLPNQGYPMYYVPSGDSGAGRLLFYREGTVVAQPFNPAMLKLSGEAVPIAEKVGSLQGFSAFFSASNNGVLVSTAGTEGSIDGQLTWFDRQGKKLGTVGEPAVFADLSLSPDGKTAVASRATTQGTLNGNLWLYDLTRPQSAPSRFTVDASLDQGAAWSGDGSRIAFMSLRDGQANIYVKLTNGAKNEELLYKSDELKVPTSWSRDGKFLLYLVRSAKTKTDLWILPLEGKQKPILFAGSEFDEENGVFSRDGHWIAYDSDATGRREIYVREFVLGSDGTLEPTPPHLVSPSGGVSPHWRDDGKELLYESVDQKAILSVEIAAKPDFKATPTKLSVPLPGNIPIGFSGDGQRFLLGMPVTDRKGPPPFTVVLNWEAGLKK